MAVRELLVGRYELRGVLGCGGMAEVRDAWDTRLRRPVAVKLLHPALNTQFDIRRRFEDEARAAAGLSHPNIVGVYDYGDDAGRPFIVMERLPGATLHDHIARGAMPPARVRTVLDDVLAALVAAHSAGMLHRDVKPGNVLVATDGATMKVTDFGIAKTTEMAHTMTGQILGTMAYMSPERVAGAPSSIIDDLYAVGVVGYEALTGRRAFPQDNPGALALAITQSPPPPISAVRPDVPPQLARVVDRAMAADPRHRFASAGQMREALGFDNAFRTDLGVVPAAPRPATKLLDEPVPVGGPGTWVSPEATYYPSSSGPRRRTSTRTKILIAAAASVALIVAVLALVTGPSSNDTPAVPDPLSTSPPAPTPPTTARAPVTSMNQLPAPPKRDGDKPGKKKGHGHDDEQ